MLRQKYFDDLVEDSIHFNSLNDSMIKLRFKTNSTNFFNTDINSIYTYGLTVTDKVKYEVFNKNENYFPISLNFKFIKLFSYLKLEDVKSYGNYLISRIDARLLDLVNAIESFKIKYVLCSIQSMLVPVTYFKYVLSLNAASGLGDYYYRYIELLSFSYTNKFGFYSTNNSINAIDHTNYLENNDYIRFLKYQSPMINYSYKSGNYLGI
jgi:hypothetical protein